MRTFRLFVTAALVLQISSEVLAGETSTSPGKHTNWGPDIDSIEIVSKFDASKYDTILIGNFSTESAPRPKKSENTWEAVNKVLSSVESILVEGARKATKKTVESGSSRKSKTLLVRGRVLEIEPGSRAGRYWSGGLGGGAAHVKISAEILDAKTGKVLVRLAQRRGSGGGMRVGGGNYQSLLSACVRSIGKDIANIVDEF